MKKKKILFGSLIALFVAVLLVTCLCLASCGKSDPTTDSTSSTAEETPQEIDELWEFTFDEKLQLPLSQLTLQKLKNETDSQLLNVGVKGAAGSFNAKLWDNGKTLILSSPDLSKSYGISYEKIFEFIKPQLPPEQQDLFDLLSQITDQPLFMPNLVTGTLSPFSNQDIQNILTDFFKETLETLKEHVTPEKSEKDNLTTYKITLTGEQIVAFLDDFFTDLKNNPKMLNLITLWLLTQDSGKTAQEIIDSWFASHKIGEDDSNHILHDSTLITFEITTAKEQNSQKIHIAFDYQPTKTSGSVKGNASLVLEENGGFEVTVIYAMPDQEETELLHILHKVEEKDGALSGKLTVSADFDDSSIDNMTILQWEYNKKTGAFSLEIPVADIKLTGNIEFSLAGLTIKDVRFSQDGQDLGIAVSVTIKNKVTEEITPPASFEEIDLNDLIEGTSPFLEELIKNPLIAAILSSMESEDIGSDLAA